MAVSTWCAAATSAARQALASRWSLRHFSRGSAYMRASLLVSALAGVVLLTQAHAAAAPWFRWESQVDGHLVCSQWSPGEGWKRFAGPFNNAACRDH